MGLLMVLQHVVFQSGGFSVFDVFQLLPSTPSRVQSKRRLPSLEVSDHQDRRPVIPSIPTETGMPPWMFQGSTPWRQTCERRKTPSPWVTLRPGLFPKKYVAPRLLRQGLVPHQAALPGETEETNENTVFSQHVFAWQHVLQ